MHVSDLTDMSRLAKDIGVRKMYHMATSWVKLTMTGVHFGHLPRMYCCRARGSE